LGSRRAERDSGSGQNTTEYSFVYVKDMTAAVENGRITSYRLNSKVTLELEGDRNDGGKKK